jgi:hypothetical protein
VPGVRSKRYSVAAIIGSVVVLAGCGGGGGVSASSYVASVCKSLGAWEHAVKEQAQTVEGKLPSVLGQAVNGGAAVLTQARTLLVTFTDELVAATKTAQNRVAAAGTPNIKNGSTLASKLHDAFGSVLTALEAARSRVSKLPTDSVSVFQSGATAIQGSIQSAFGSVGNSVPNSPELNAAAKKTPACVTIGFTS